MSFPRLFSTLAIAHCAFLSVGLSKTERIVSLGGSTTEIVCALGAGDQLVARDSSSVFPQDVRALPDVGYFRTLSAEGVLAQKPTLILAAQGAGPAAQVELLKASGVPFIHLAEHYSVETLLGNIRLLGDTLGRKTEAEQLARKLEARLHESEARFAGQKPPRVVFLLSISGTDTQAAYDDTAATAVIQLAGGRNPLTGLKGYKPLNAEALLAMDPDIILYGRNPLLPQSAQSVPDWLKRETRAGRAGHIYPIDLGYHLVFGPRLGDAVGEVAAFLHPDAPETVQR